MRAGRRRARRASASVDAGVRRGPIGVGDAMPAAWRAQMLAQQLAGLRIEQPHVQVVPLHLDALADPAGRRAVVRGLDLDAAIEMHGALAVPVVAKRLERAAGRARAAPRQTSRRPGASSCRGCACRPSASPSDRDRPARPRASRSAAPCSGVFCAWPTPASTLPLRSGSRDATRQRDDAVVRQHVAIERIERRVVDVGREHALAQIVEDDDRDGATEATKGPLVQLRPDLRARLPREQPHALCASSRASAQTAACAGTCRVAGSRTIGPSP